MFRHHGNTRTLRHNLKIASLLSFVAGIVSTVGFFSVQKLTTNVTGHFAFFMDEAFKLHFKESFIYFLYIFSFFFGSFVSNFLIEIISRKNERYIYVVPTLIESIILFILGFYGKDLIVMHPNLIAFSLLFAMGLQNSFVTTISSSVVRTTHLTGLFTDLGIDLSQFFFYKETEKKKKLISSIKLRFTIISFFFFGGIIGGILYSKIGILSLTAASITLLLGLLYDYLKFKIIVLKRKFQKKSRVQ
jgi:uncharacterized membrane protein YoaK (UPF0700 family)